MQVQVLVPFKVGRTGAAFKHHPCLHLGVHADTSQGKANPDCPVNLLATKSFIDSQSIAQLETTARTLPGMIHGVGQPDLHPGTKFPIGAVFVSQEWIHPPLIGGDIGCGMAWYKTRLSRHQVDGDKGRKVAEKLRGLEGPWRKQVDRELWLTESDTCYSAGLEWDASLGTIGAGNHFAEIQVVEQSSTDELKEDMVVLLVHSGSRGYGGNILKRFSADGCISLHEDDPKTKQYLEEHEKACQWARLNRDLIALRFLACLEAEFELDLAHPETTLSIEAIKNAKQVLLQRKVVDIWHNNVQKVPWPPSAPKLLSDLEHQLLSTLEGTKELNLEDSAKNKLKYAYIHRKGAAPTQDPLTSKPLSILPLPGSRGTPTLILRPTLSARNTWGKKNALSLAHGAGRAMSRAKALVSMSQKYSGDTRSLTVPSNSAAGLVKDPKSVKGGTWVICDEKQLVWEEAEDAYKDVVAVGDDLVNAGAAEVLGWLRPRVCYKIRTER